MRRPALAVLALVIGLSLVKEARANEGGASFFVRGDSDSTTVINPRATIQATLNEERTTVNAAYSADIWTSASIDIRTAATRPITEQRDQIDVSGSHTIDDVTLGASYYFSGENDYWSHGVSLRAVEEVANKSTTLEQSIRFSHDMVGRSGDDAFSRPLDTYGLRLVLTQILSPVAIVQAVWEGGYRDGYQASPYRFVGLGGDGMCAGTAQWCIPEAHPSTRIRNAFVVQARYNLSQDASAGAGYRLYFDDWGVVGHTAIAQVAWLAAEDATITLRYRFYSQGAAAFYRSRYENADETIKLATRDRELSPMFSNRVSIGYETSWPLSDGIALRFALAVGGTVFVYSDFVGLTEVFAGDATLALTLEL
jgi:hypothetical protein